MLNINLLSSQKLQLPSRFFFIIFIIDLLFKTIANFKYILTVFVPSHKSFQIVSLSLPT